jgi:VWFA-related protein
MRLPHKNTRQRGVKPCRHAIVPGFVRELCALFLVGALLLTPAGQIMGQQSPVYSVHVKVVNMLATVRDKHGLMINNLSKDDFVLEEDGRPQTIRYFTQDTDLPLTLGLLVDTSMSQIRVLDRERTASHSFLDQILREDKDLAFLIHFDSEVELLQDLTSSRPKLEAALDDVQMTQREPQQPTSWPGSGRGGAGAHHGRPAGTLLYDSVYLAADELMSKQKGRKALVILTDGVDQGSKLSLQTAVESAQRADTIVYGILFADDQFYDRGGLGGWGRRGGRIPFPPVENHPDGKKVLEQISKQTGGRMFEVSKKQSIEKIYAQIQEELRNQYSIGYTPDPPHSDSGYHKIHLSVKQKDMQVQTREGYYSDR